MAMATFECKNCGASLEVEPGATVVTCDYCHSTQTLPRLDDGKRAGMFRRGNELRRAYEFDRAADLFGRVLDEDAGDAEAYWSLALCRYGVVYVEDPRTRDMVPTVNRMQAKSITADADYRQALECAGAAQRDVIESQAAQIADIQRGISEVAAKDEPYDVFICYKDSDAAGGRTEDSVIAGDIYDALRKDGLRVFYSRETLKGMLGSAFEPHIFAALHSARVMVAVGTCREHFESPWVRNEWSRYLALCDEDRDLTFVPAFKGMSAGELPAEFRSIQGQDLSGLGGMQDLIRYVEGRFEMPERRASYGGSIFHGSASVPPRSGSRNSHRREPEPAPAGSLASVESLTQRMDIFIEDGDFEEAIDYANRVLDADPKNVDAYMGLALCDEEVNSREEFYALEEGALDNDNFAKAVRYSKEGSEVRRAHDELVELTRKKAYKIVLDSKVISDDEVNRFFNENKSSLEIFERGWDAALKNATSSDYYSFNTKQRYPGYPGVVCASREAAKHQLESAALQEAALLYALAGEGDKSTRYSGESKRLANKAREEDANAWTRKVAYVDALLLLVRMQKTIQGECREYSALKEQLSSYGELLVACKVLSSDTSDEKMEKNARLKRSLTGIIAVSPDRLARYRDADMQLSEELASAKSSFEARDIWFGEATRKAMGDARDAVSACLAEAVDSPMLRGMDARNGAVFDPSVDGEMLVDLAVSAGDWASENQTRVGQLETEKKDLSARLEALEKDNAPLVKIANMKQQGAAYAKKTLGTKSGILRLVAMVVVVVILFKLGSCVFGAFGGSVGSSDSVKVDCTSDASIQEWLSGCDSDDDGTVTAEELEKANVRQIALDEVADDSALRAISGLPIKQDLVVGDISSPSFDGSNLSGMTSLGASFCEANSIDLTSCAKLETINLGINTDDLGTFNASGLNMLEYVQLSSKGGQRTVQKVDLHGCKSLRSFTTDLHIKELDIRGCDDLDVSYIDDADIDKIIK